jgi:thiamine pyrophosphokinase
MEIVAVHDQKKPLERPVVAGQTAVTLIGGGALRDNDLAEALDIAPLLVAVDGGADAAMAAGLTPQAVLGDLDSVSATTRAALGDKIFYEISEQNSTDFDKALRHLRVPLVLAVGFTGARLDHELAVFHSLVARPDHRCIVLGERDIVFHAPPRLRMDLAADTRVSLFPMAAVSGRSSGLHWPIDGLAFHPAEYIGTSNAATGGAVEIEADRPGLLVILPRSELDAAVTALSQHVENLWIV